MVALVADPVDTPQSRFKVLGQKFRNSFKKVSERRAIRAADDALIEELQVDLIEFAKTLGDESLDDLLSQSTGSDSAEGGEGEDTSFGCGIANVGGDLDVIFESQAEGAYPLTGAALDTLQDAAKAYADGRVLAACQIISRLGQDESPAAVSAACDLQDINLGEMQQSAQLVGKCLQDLADNSSWTQVSKGNLKCWFKWEPGSHLYSCKFMGMFHAPLDRVLAITRELDLQPTWTHTCVEATKLYEVSELEAYYYGAQWQPAPFKEQEMIFSTRQFDLSREDGSVLMTLQSVNGDQLPDGSLPLPEDRERERMALLQGSCIRLKPLPPGPDGSPRTLGHVMLNLAPLHTSCLPVPLIKFFAKILAPTVFRHANKVLAHSFQHEDDSFPVRMAQHKHLYDRVKSLESYCIRRQLYRSKSFVASQRHSQKH